MTELSELYFTPTSLSLLSMAILSLTITGYFLSLKTKTPAVWQLSLFFTGMTGFLTSLSVFQMASAFHPWVLPAVSLSFTFGSAALIGLMAFVYQLPQRVPHQERERRIALIVTIAMALFQIAMCILVYGSSNMSALLLQILVVFWGWTWVMIVFLRRWMFFRRRGCLSEARALRAFILSFLPHIIAYIGIVLLTLGMIPFNIGVPTVCACIFLFLFTFTVSYINYAPHPTTFMVKLVGMIFVIFLLILGNLGYLMAPFIEPLYTPSAMLKAGRSLRFQPNDRQSYDISWEPLDFESNLGEKLPIERLRHKTVPIGFPFPFYGQSYTSMQIFSVGYLAFAPDPPAFFVEVGLSFPFIAPVWLPLDTSVEAGGIFYRQEEERAIVTWYQLPPYNNLGPATDQNRVRQCYTAQAILSPDGSFSMNYRDFPDTQNFSMANRYGILAGVGISPGGGRLNTVQDIRFMVDLPYSGSYPHPILQRFENEFIQFMDKALRPLAYLIVGVGGFILIGFPFFFRVTLVRPLQRLVDGMKEVEEGDLSTQVDVTYHDEIGYLTTTFNDMVHSVHAAELERIRAIQLEQEKNIAEAANQAKSAFLANMTHELRSPLNAILGFAHVFLRDRRLDRDQRENINIITRSGEHLLSLIDQVLDLSKIEAGRMTLNPRDFNLKRLLDDVEQMFRLKAKEKQVQLLFQCDPDVPAGLHTDELKLRQVLINLLNNAIKFTEQGGVTVEVTKVPEVPEVPNVERGPSGEGPGVGPKSQISNLKFEISDTGPGISPEEMNKLFEAFEQTSSGRKSNTGTGLGLPISRKFVQLMGGDIQVKSEVGHGTLFTFDIQAYVVDSIVNRQSSINNRVIALEPGQPHYRILVVDDKPMNRLLLVKLLQPSGFDVREAGHGEEAIQIWEEWKPHLIWMDMRLPGLDGCEITKIIRKAESRRREEENTQAETRTTWRHPRTIIIALTASIVEQERALMFSAGCDDFLRKPFRDRDIFELTAKHLGVRFEYEAETPLSAANVDIKELPAVLAQLPPDILERLLYAAERSDMELIERAIDDIRAYQPSTADVLTEWANNFQYERIISLIQQVKQ